MKSEEINETIEPKDNQVPTENHEAMSDEHNPEVGEPEVVADNTPLQSEEEKWKESAADWRDKYMRLYAEFDNFRKRSQKERVELLQTASSDVIKELLTVLDDFDRAVKANETLEDIAIVKEGFVLIHQKLYRQMEAKGLKPINATGEVFNTDFHEAITQIPAPTADLKGKVVDEVERGYVLNDKVIRFSKVVIGQ